MRSVNALRLCALFVFAFAGTLFADSTKDVNVANTVVVREEGQPFQNEGFFSFAPNSGSLLGTVDIPANKRLVIESISAAAVMDCDCTMDPLDLGTFIANQSNPIGVDWLFTFSEAPTLSNIKFFALPSVSTRMYTDTGVQVVAQRRSRNGSFGTFGSLTVTVSGRLVPIQ